MQADSFAEVASDDCKSSRLRPSGLSWRRLLFRSSIGSPSTFGFAFGGIENAICAAIDAVAAEPRGVGRLIRVETRGVVVDQWKDEIHPNRKGAKRVAKAFEQELRKQGLLP